MPFLQTSGAISIANLNSFFGGSGTSMSNFYRGGARVPSTKTVSSTVREPTSGEMPYNSSVWGWYGSGGGFYLRWAGGAWIYNGSWPSGNAQNMTTYTSGGYTYYRGTLRGTWSDGYSVNQAEYSIYRIGTSSSTVSINAGIPASGQLSLSQFYGAEMP